MGQTERLRAASDGWVQVEAPGQSGGVYVEAGDEVKITFDPDDEEG